MAEKQPPIPEMSDIPTTIPGPAGSRWHDGDDTGRRDDDQDVDEASTGGASASGPVHSEDAHRDSLRPDPTAPPEARTTAPEPLQGGDDRP